MSTELTIDIHVHTHQDMPALVCSAGRARIDRVCLSSLGLPYTRDPSEEQIREANDDVLVNMKAHPDLFVGFCYLNPRHSPEFSLGELDRCASAGMRGVKLWVYCPASDPRVVPIAEEAGRRGMPLLQHSFHNALGTKEGESTALDVAQLAAKVPGLAIIMAHLTGNGYLGILEVAPYPNVHIDTSGGYPTSAVTEYALRVLGPKRVLFGSDAPGRNFVVQLARARSACRDEAEERAVLGGNARRLLRI